MKKGKTRILAIVGASGSGKTTLANYLQRECRIPTIISYTTRPMRPGETEGVEHLFVNECTAPQEELLAYTKYGDYFYWTELTQVKAHDVCTYVIDE